MENLCEKKSVFLFNTSSSVFYLVLRGGGGLYKIISSAQVLASTFLFMHKSLETAFNDLSLITFRWNNGKRMLGDGEIRIQDPEGVG